MDRRQAVLAAIDDTEQSLLRLTRIGWKGVDCSESSLALLDAWTSAPCGFAGDKSETLEVIRSDLGDCRLCKLSSGRKNIVFGAGNSQAQLVFVGEGPGYDEDLQGQPFVGAAGQLLTKIIQAIGLNRESVYICNIIKCRPPGNRNPQPDEISACSPFLRRQLESIAPDFICALGTFAAQTLLQTTTPISRLRGRFFDYMGAKLMPTYHPAYLLRNPEQKRTVWEDMQLLMRAMGLPRPERRADNP
ncbi:MAG: uracil-DNA glycosylase [Deltaproteobacteria bacterium]|nr:uracil-DNA glycosylase [Deltaproteobacteria bacterium]